MRPEWVMYAWAATQSCGPAPVDVGPVLQERSAATDLTLFFFLLHFFCHLALAAALRSTYSLMSKATALKQT